MFVGALVVLAGADRAQVATREAVVSFMYGDVQVRHGTAGYKAAKTNERLQPGDAIKTGADSRAEISLSGGGYLRMDESSQLLITHLEEKGTTSFQTLIGGVWVTIEQALSGGSKFQIEMPSAVASVQGTVFRCEVDEEGESSTYVYDGQVELTAGDVREKVVRAQWAKVARDRRVALSDIDFDQDDVRAFVQHSRNRDIARHLGNPKIMVALSDGQNEQERRAAYLASQLTANKLQRLGFVGAGVAEKDISQFDFGQNGWVDWRGESTYDYFIVGKVELDEVKRIDGGRFSSRVSGGAYLLPKGGKQALTKATATERGEGKSEEDAIAAGVQAISGRLAGEMAPAMVQAMMDRSGKLMRIEVAGISDRRSPHLIVAALREIPGVVRVTPLGSTDHRIAFAVAGTVPPQALANVLRKGERVESVRVVDKVIYVRLTPTAMEPGARDDLRPVRPTVSPQGDKPPRPGNRPPRNQQIKRPRNQP
jgi:hypothetical protein